MSEGVGVSEQERVEARLASVAFARKHLRWNYGAFALESGVYMGGMAFIAQETVLPNVVKELGGSDVLIALMPTLAIIGFFVPQLFVAHIVERLPRAKRWVQYTSIPQRLMFLLAGLALLFLADDHPRLTLAMVVAAPFISGFCAGINGMAWLDFISRAVPARRRGSLAATRNLVGTVLGVLAGHYVVSRVLEANPGTTGYGLLHVICFGFLALSFLIFSTTKEPPKPPWQRPPAPNLRASLSLIAQLPKLDARLKFYALNRFWGTLLWTVPPFLSIHALRVTERGADFLGELIAAQMVGAIFGNLVGGYVSDRSGGRVVFIVSKVLGIAYAVGAALNGSEFGFLAIYFAFGACIHMAVIGDSTLGVELAPAERLPTYLATFNAVALPGMLLAAGLSAVIERTVGHLYPAAAVAALGTGLSLIYLLRIPEPRSNEEDGQEREGEKS